MPSRSLRDAREEPTPSPPPPSFRPPGQLQLSPALERALVLVIEEDYRHAKAHRDGRSYGKTAKGEGLTFATWFKRVNQLYTGEREPKPLPFQFCSNRSLRIATAILDTIHARLYPTVVNADLVRWRPGEATDTPRVERITAFMRWWLWVHVRFQRFLDDWLKVLVGFGECLVESSWHVAARDTGQTESTPIVGEAGQPLLTPEGQPSVSQQRLLRFEERTRSRLYLRDHFYLQPGAQDVQADPVILEEAYLYRELAQLEAEGQLVNVQTLLLPKLTVEEPPTAGMDPAAQERLRDVRRRNVSVPILKWYGAFDADGDGFAEDLRILIAPDQHVYLGGMRVLDLTASGKRPLSYRKFESRLEDPQSLWGVGMLEKVRELAEELDALYNQIADASTLSVLRPGFYDPAGDLQAPILTLAPNRLIPVSDPSRNVHFPALDIPINNLVVVVRLVLEFVERLTAASAYVLGKESEIVGGSGTATRTNAIVEASNIRYALPAERVREGAAELLRQHLDLIQLHIPPGLEQRVLGDTGEPLFQANELTAEGLRGEFDAYLLPDPSMGSEQTERDLMGALYGVLLNNPVVATDMTKLYQVTADLLKAYGKDPVRYLGPAPASDDVDDPEEENTLILQGDFTRVTAQLTENHLLHLQTHQALLESPSLAALPPHLVQQVTGFLQAHIQQHQHLLLVMMHLMQQVGGSHGPNASSAGAQGAPTPAGLATPAGPLGRALLEKGTGEVSGPAAS